MSLFDKLGTTSLKSLKYGRDSFGGGDSLEPIIQKPIKNNNPQGVETSVKDVATENEKRISNLLDKTPRGYKFKYTQKQLQLSNTRIESRDSNISSRTRINPLIYYNPENTIAQIGRNPSDEGEHYTRFGVSPFMEEGNKYISVVTSNNVSNNRLDKLRKKLQVGYIPSQNASILKNNVSNSLLSTILSISNFSNTIAGVFNIFGGNKIVNNINSKINQIGKTIIPSVIPKDAIIDEYNGGPGALYGTLGTTKIRRFDYTNQIDASKFKSFSDARTSAIKLTPSYRDNQQVDIRLLASSSLNPALSFVSKPIKYYDGAKVNTTGTSVKYSYNVNSLEGSVSLYRSAKNYKYLGDKQQTTSTFDRIDGDNMTIVFQLLDPFTGDNLQRLAFSAYLNGFKTSTDSTWNSIDYIGRSDHFYTYSKFNRTVSFNLQIPCFNIIELREKHRALAALESSLMGKYSKGNKLGGILTKLYLGNYLRGETGFISSLSYDIPNDSAWDLDEQLAHNINLSINFTVIHNQLPTYDSSGQNLIKVTNGVDGFITSIKALERAGVPDLKQKDFANVNRPAIDYKNTNTLVSKTLQNLNTSNLQNRLSNIIK